MKKTWNCFLFFFLWAIKKYILSHCSSDYYFSLTRLCCYCSIRTQAFGGEAGGSFNAESTFVGVPWDSSYSLNPARGMFYLVNLANPGRLGNVLSTQQAQCPKWLQCLCCPPFTCQLFSIWVIGNVSPDSSHREVDSLDHDGNTKRRFLIYLEA